MRYHCQFRRYILSVFSLLALLQCLNYLWFLTHECDLNSMNYIESEYMSVKPSELYLMFESTKNFGF